MPNHYSFKKRRGQSTCLSLRNAFLVPVLLVLWSMSASAQAPTISYPSVAQGLTRGYSQSNLTVKLVFNGVCAGTNTVRIAFPASVTYVAGSVTKTAGSPGLSIAEGSIANLSRPELSISGIAAVGDSITFTVARRADCGSLATAKDSVYFIAGSGCSNASEVAGTVNTYNIFSPALSLTPAAALTDVLVGTTATRTTTVTNGGNGDLDTLRFYVVYPGGGIVNTNTNYRITANSVNFDTLRKSGDTLFYKIYGPTIFGGNHLLTSGETVTIREPVRIVKCNITTTYGARWGRNNNTICNTASATSSISMKAGVADLTSGVMTLVGYTNKCNPFAADFKFTNGGSGDDTAGAMYDITAQIGHAPGVSLSSIDTTVFAYYDFRVGSSTIPAVSYVGSNPNFIYQVALNNLFSSDPDGAGIGLEDVDGDGFYDDLPTGNAITLRFSVRTHCDRACGSNIEVLSAGGRTLYHTMCDKAMNTVSDRVSSGSYMHYEYGFQGVGYIPANVQNGIPFRISAAEGHYINSSIFDLPNTRYRWKVALPPGFSVSGTGNPTYGTTPVSYSTISGGVSGVDTIVYTSATNSLANFNIDLVVNCTATTGGAASVYYQLEKINDITSPECRCHSKKICATLKTQVFCPGPCAGGPANYIPTVRRANGSLGWTDHTLSTRQTASSISAFDLSKALYLDTIIVQCRAKQGTVSATNLHQELTLNKGTGGESKLMPVRAVSYFYRSGSLAHTCTTALADQSASTAAVQSIDWNLSSCLSGLRSKRAG